MTAPGSPKPPAWLPGPIAAGVLVFFAIMLSSASSNHRTNNDGGLAARLDPTYSRPSNWRAGMREQVFERNRAPDGKVYDPSGVEIKFDDPWQMGHVPGYEFAKHQISAWERELDRDEFLDEYYDVRIYRPELPKSNRSHQYEAPEIGRAHV